MFQRVTFKFLLAISILAGLGLVLFANTALAQDFQYFKENRKGSFVVGEQWSRTAYNNRLTSTESLNNLIKITARVDLPSKEHGTAVYLGKFAGEHLMITNFHAIKDSKTCFGTKVYFEFTRERFSCGKVLAIFKDLETTFFTIPVDPKQEYLFENLALKMDFVTEYTPGHKLVTTGYGLNLNSGRKLTYEISQTCVVATSTYKTKIVRVVTETKTSAAYSFVHACEISPGDSGSVVVSETTGKIVGLNWATSYKPKALSNTLTVFDWIENDSPLMWDAMSYAVPAGLIMNAIRATDNVPLNEFVSSHFIQ